MTAIGRSPSGAKALACVFVAGAMLRAAAASDADTSVCEGGDGLVLLQTGLHHQIEAGVAMDVQARLNASSLADQNAIDVSLPELYRNNEVELQFAAVLFVPLLMIIWLTFRLTAKNDGGRMEALDGIRFLMQAGVVIYHLVANGWLPNWLGVYGARMTHEIALFFVISGFFIGVQLTPKLNEPRFSLGAFMFVRIMRIYPVYLLSIGLALLITPWELAKPFLPVMIPPVTCWVDWAFVNPLNVPAWCAGALLYCSMLSPALLKLINVSTVQTRWGTLMPVAWVCTLWAAWAQTGHYFVVLEPVNKLFIWAPHVPEFFAGLVLGTCFLARQHADTPTLPQGLVSEVMTAFGPTLACCLTFFPLFCPIFDAQTSTMPMVVKWGEQGLFLPIMLFVVWQYAMPEAHMCPIKTILSSGLCGALGSISFTAYLLQMFVFDIVDKHLPQSVAVMLPPKYTEVGSAWRCVPFLFALITFAWLVHHLFEMPIWRHSIKLLEKLAGKPSASDSVENATQGQAAKPKTRPKGSSWELPMSWNFTRGVLYYLFFALTVGGYFMMVAGVFRNKAEKTTLLSIADTVFERPYQIFLWVLMGCFLPGVILNTSGHFLFPAFVHKQILPIFGKPDDEPMFSEDLVAPAWRLHFRWVTRGDNPNLVSQTIYETQMLLQGMNMNPKSYVLEVVTDNAINCAAMSGVPVEEIVVPTSYQSSTNAKFKARALNYAIHNSTTRSCDWIVHLDEETKISERVVAHLWNHVEEELAATARGERPCGHYNIGQGTIVYGAGKHGVVSNWITTLSDTGRVGDDYGKFRMQYEHSTTLIGMHGSFIIISQPVEELVTYDHGHAGSICEDLYFALIALGEYGIGYSWVDGFMYEQSPFNLMDLVKQRQRWFSGMFLVVFCDKVPMRQRLTLALFCFSWNLLPVIAVVMMIMIFIQANESIYLATAMATLNTLMMSSYFIGFTMTYRIEEGIVRYLLLFMAQLNGAPLFGVLEAMGAFRALTRSEAYMGFHVVQKEFGGASGNGIASNASTHAGPTSNSGSGIGSCESLLDATALAKKTAAHKELDLGQKKLNTEDALEAS